MYNTLKTFHYNSTVNINEQETRQPERIQLPLSLAIPSGKAENQLY